MNVLFIGIDHTLCDPPASDCSSSLTREQILARHLDTYHLLIMTLKKSAAQPLRMIGNNLRIYASRSASVFSMVRDAWRMAADICREQPVDLISTQDPLLTGWVGYRLSRRFGLPWNVQLHGDYLNNPYWLRESMQNRGYNLLGKYLLPRTDTIIAVHPELKRCLERLINPDRVPRYYLPHGLGIDTALFREIESTALADVPQKKGDETRVLFAGRLVAQKNLRALLHAIPQVLRVYPKTLFLLAGEGPQRNRLQTLSRSLKITANIRWLGDLAYRDMPSVYRASDLFVLPSFYEGYPRVLMEAAASGLPIVSTPITGVNEIIEQGQNGHITAGMSAEPIAQGIIQILDNMEAYKSAASQKRLDSLQRFDMQRSMQNLCDSWRKTILAYHQKGRHV